MTTMKTTTNDIAAQAQAELDELHTQRDTLAADGRAILDRSQGALSEEDQTEFERIETELTGLKRRERFLQTIASGRIGLEQHEEVRREVTRQVPPGDLRSEALRTVEAAVKLRHLPEHAAEKVERLVTDGPELDRTLAARWAVATGDPNYSTAFVKLCGDPVRGHLLWTPEEHESYRRVAEVRAAMSLTDANGGYMVPFTLDPAIMLTSDGSVNPLRQISRVVQTVTDSWTGITSAGTTAEWKAEGAEVADASPTVDDAPIPVHFADVFTQWSYEVGMDASNFLTELRKVMVDAADQLKNTAYTVGTGTGQPKGFVTALAGTASEINGGGTEALVAADAFTLQNALPPRFQPRAQWTANLTTINTFRQFETTNGALKFPELANGQLLSRKMNEVSNMDGSINAAATANNYLLTYGDFSHFVIVDRIGTQIEFIPNLMGANRRPTAQRGALLWFRTGSDVVVPQAFRMLDVPTTA